MTSQQELTNVVRLIDNTLNLISDASIRGNDAAAVHEIQSWLVAFRSSVQTELAKLAKPEPSVQEAVVVPTAEPVKA